jgi:tetratricopeptide (TPR) repeat protein
MKVIGQLFLLFLFLVALTTIGQYEKGEAIDPCESPPVGVVSSVLDRITPWSLGCAERAKRANKKQAEWSQRTPPDDWLKQVPKSIPDGILPKPRDAIADLTWMHQVAPPKDPLEVGSRELNFRPLMPRPATREDVMGCDQTDDLQVTIHGCTSLATDPGTSLKLKASAYAKLGAAYFDTGQNDSASDALSKAIELGNGHALVYALRAVTYAWSKKYDLAIADANRAINMDEAVMWAYVARGDAHANTNQYLEAIQDYSKAIELNEPYPKQDKHLKAVLHSERGRCRFLLVQSDASSSSMLEHLSAAKADYKQAIEYEATLTEAQVGLDQVERAIFSVER